MSRQSHSNARRLVAVIAALVIVGAGALAWSRLLPKLQQATLIEAAKQGNVGAVRRLLDSGVDPNAPPPGRRALDSAILWGRAGVVTALLDHGAIVEPGGAFETAPLAEAVATRQPGVVRILLSHGANANRKDPNGMQTLLNLAFFGHNAAVMQALLQGGADPNMADRRKGMTALMWSARGGELAMVQALIAHGARVNARARDTGETVLMQAVRGGHLPVIQYLLAHGANVNAKHTGNRGPYTALTVAEEDLHIFERQRDRGFVSERAGLDRSVAHERELIEYLEQAGAKE